MKKGLIGFIAGLVGLIVIGCVAVLIYGSVHDLSFLDVLRHWLGC